MWLSRYKITKYERSINTKSYERITSLYKKIIINEIQKDMEAQSVISKQDGFKYYLEGREHGQYKEKGGRGKFGFLNF